MQFTNAHVSRVTSICTAGIMHMPSNTTLYAYKVECDYAGMNYKVASGQVKTRTRGARKCRILLRRKCGVRAVEVYIWFGNCYVEVSRCDTNCALKSFGFASVCASCLHPLWAFYPFNAAAQHFAIAHSAPISREAIKHKLNCGPLQKCLHMQGNPAQAHPHRENHTYSSELSYNHKPRVSICICVYILLYGARS